RRRSRCCGLSAPRWSSARRRSRPSRRKATTPCRRASPRRFPVPTNPTSTRIQPIPRPTTRPRDRRSGSRQRASWRRSFSRSGRAERSPARPASPRSESPTHWAPAPTIEEVLAFKRRAEGEVPQLIYVESHRKVGEAVDLMHRYGISQIPVIRHEPAASLADLIGSIQERGLLERVLRNPDTLNEEVASAMDPPLRAVEVGDSVNTVFSDIEAGNSAVVVAAAGKPVGVLTRADLLEY